MYISFNDGHNRIIPAIQARLEEEAARQGVDVERLTQTVVGQLFGTDPEQSHDTRPFHERASAAEWTTGFQAWVEIHEDLTRLSLSNEALRREYLYEDRGR